MDSTGSRLDSLKQRGVTRLVLGALSICTILFLLWYFSDVVIYILVSAVLAIMFRPLVNTFSGLRVAGRRVSRGVAALFTLLLIWLICWLVIYTVVPLIFSQLRQLAELDMPTVVSNIEEPILTMQHHIQEVLSLPERNIDLSQSLAKWGREVVDLNAVNGAFSSVVGLMVSSVITFFSVSFITFFFLKDDNLFYSMVTSIFPSKYGESVTHAMDSITKLLSRYFTGLMLESTLIAFAVSLVMICWGMIAKDAIFMGLVMGVLNVVPYAGPFIGACFAMFLGIVSPIEGFTAGHTVGVIAASLLVVKGLDDFLLQPTLYSERVKAHPLEIFIVILLSGYVAGIVGMLLAIPSYTVLRVFAKEFFSQYSLVQKLTKEI